MSLYEIELPIHSHRRMPNPYNLNEISGGIESYIIQVDVTQIPEGISLDTNPRKQNMRTKVARRIKEGLLDSTTPFHILNRGILLSAKKITFDSTNNNVKIDMGEEPMIYGIVDGGHTYRTILENKQEVKKKNLKQYVRIEVLTGIEDIFQAVADSRNTSTQVTDQAIAELNKKFDPVIKDALKDEQYADNIGYKENEEALIDVSDILTLLYMFNLDRFPDKDKLPVQAYSAKAATLRDYLKEFEEYEATPGNAYYKMKNIMPDIIKLADIIEVEMGEKYRENNPNGAFGRTKGVDRVKGTKSTYLQNTIQHRISKGLIYPIIGSFRALLVEENNEYKWQSDPFKIWDSIGATLVEDTIGRSRSFNNNPNATGKDRGLWRQNYQTVFTEFLMKKFDEENK